MKSQFIDGHEVAWDGRTVWVNSGQTGMSLARFGRAGIDVHMDAEDQMRTGRQCLACSHPAKGFAQLEDWHKFRELVKTHHGVTVPENMIPAYLEGGSDGR